MNNNHFYGEVYFFVFDELFDDLAIVLDSNDEICFDDLFEIRLVGSEIEYGETVFFLSVKNISTNSENIVKVFPSSLKNLHQLIELSEAFSLVYEKDFCTYTPWSLCSSKAEIRKAGLQLSFCMNGMPVFNQVISEASEDNYIEDLEYFINKVYQVLGGINES